MIRSVAEVAECLTATRPRSEELRTVTATPHKPSENQAMMECALDRQTFLLNITKGQYVAGIASKSRTRRLQYVPVR